MNENLALPTIAPFILSLGIWLIILVWGIYKCFKIAKRDTTSGICVYSLATILGCFLFGIFIKILSSLQPAAPIITLSAGLLMIFGLIIAGCLAIVGLIEYQRHPQYRQGRKQAITTLVTCAVFFALVGTGMVKGYNNRHAPPSGFATATKNESVEFADLNYRFRLPGKPYVELDASAFNADASFMIMRRAPQVWFFIIAEKYGFNGESSTDHLAQISKANIQSVASRYTISEERPLTHSPYSGVTFSVNARLEGLDMFYCFWVFERNGYAYQLITFGKERDSQKVVEEAHKLFANFEQIDLEKIYYANGFKSFGTHRSESLGFSIDLDKTDWMRWENIEDDFPNAEVGAHFQNQLFGFVMPIYYGDDQPDLDILTENLFQDAEYYFPNDNQSRKESISGPGWQGYRFAYLQKNKGVDYNIRCEVRAGSDVGYLISAWSRNDFPGKEERVRQFFESIRFDTGRPESTITDILSPAQRQKQARLINRLGRFYHEKKQYDQSLACFLRSNHFDARNPEYIVDCLDVYNQLKQNKAALAFLDNLDPQTPVNDDILSWKAWHLKSCGKEDEALAIYDALFSRQYFNEEDFTIYTQLLFDHRQWEKMDALFEVCLKKTDSIGVWLQQAKMLQKRAKHDEAVSILNTCQKDKPFNPRIAYALINSYTALGRYNDALKTADALIDKGHASADAYYYKADAEYHLRWYHKAKQSLEKAAALAPRDENIHVYLKHISALLGQGSNSTIKAPIDPVPLPPYIAGTLPDIRSRPSKDGFDSYYLNVVKCYLFNKGQPLKETIYKRIKVVNSGGVSRFNTIEVDFNPVKENLYVNHLLIRDPEGNIISRGNLSDYYITDTNSTEMATHDQTLYIPVPQLAPGHTIDIAYTKQDLADCTRLPFHRVWFSAPRPVLLSAVHIQGDPKEVKYQSINSPKPVKSGHGLTWTLKNPEVYQWEPIAVNYEKHIPLVLFGGDGQTWEQVTRAYLDKIRDRLKIDYETKQLAVQLTRRHKTAEDKLLALAEHIQSGFTYKAIEFGSRGQIPNSTKTTLNNRYGDCKDHSLLLHQMLSAVGIKSHLALVNTDFAIEPALPSLDQFNHMIVYVPGPSHSGRFFDVTNKDQDMRLATPAGLAEQTALVLDSRKGYLADIPPYVDNCHMTSSRNIAVVDQNDLMIKEKIVLTGYIAGFMRNHLKSIEPARHLMWSQELISDFQNSARVVSFKLSHLFENSKDLTIDMEYEISRQCVYSDNAASFRIPSIWEKYYLSVTPVRDRKSPFKISYPLNVQSNIYINGPKGYEFNWPQNKDDNGQAPFGKWYNTMKQQGETQELQFSCTLQPGVYAPDKYNAYETLMDNAIGSISHEIKYQYSQLNTRPGTTTSQFSTQP